MATSGRRSGQIWPAMAPSDSRWMLVEGSGEKSGGHRASCSPSHTVSGCLGGDQPPVFDHFSSKSGAIQLRRRCRAPIQYTSAAASLKDSVEARGGLVSATTMRDGDTASKGLKFWPFLPTSAPAPSDRAKMRTLCARTRRRFKNPRQRSDISSALTFRGG